MRKIILLIATILLSINAVGQTQYGYVQTRGRLGTNGSVIPGVRLNGVTIHVKGRSQVVVSRNNGTFSFPVSSAKFYITSVKLAGYDLVDPDVISRRYTYSKDSLVILMESTATQADDKLAVERKERRMLKRVVQQIEYEMGEWKAQNRITEDEYRKLMRKLKKETEDNEKDWVG